MRKSRISFPCIFKTLSVVAASAALQIPTYSQDLPPANVAVDAPVEIEVDTQIKAQKGKISAPPGVIIAAPDEEIILETASGKPRVEINKKVRAGKADSDIERRLERMERLIENLVENDHMLRKNAPVVAFNGKEFAKVQKDMDRAMREADMAIRKMPKPVKNDFNFEHHFSFKGDGKNQRKVLEAQRKALQKQLEVLDRQLESLDQEAEANGDGIEKEAEITEEKEVSKSAE